MIKPESPKGEQIFRHSIMKAFCSIAIIIMMFPSFTFSKNIKQKTFASPEEAVQAVVDALQKNDIGELLSIFGPEGKDLVDSGDPVADKAGRERSLRAFQEMHKLEGEGEGMMILSVGNDDWPFPIPIMKKNNVWYFDTKAGKEELLNRRIGRNELDVIQVLLAYVDAQYEYASKDRDGDGVLEYAQKFLSDEDKRNGLYWEVAEGEEQSPIGPLVVSALKEGYTKRKAGDKPVPYYGYYYKILKGQGKNAPGGKYSYVVNGNMIFGFAAIAYPAKYRNSGVKTFMVNQQGIVYEKDLGKSTEKIAQAMDTFDPDKSWKKVE